MRKRLFTTIGAVLASIVIAAVVVTVPAAAQQQNSKLDRIMARFLDLREKVSEAKSEWRANPTRRTESTAHRLRDRAIAYKTRHRGELQTVWNREAAEYEVNPNKTNKDAFGYTASDNVPYDFVDISDNGTKILTFGDDVSVAVELEAPFSFYGQTAQTLVMDTNGYIHTRNSGFLTSQFTNVCPLPAKSVANGLGNNDAAMFVLWDDLDFSDPFTDESGMFVDHYAVCPRPNDTTGADEACTVFMWDNARHFVGEHTDPDFDMEAIIYHSTGQFVYQIGAGNPETGGGSTTGSADWSADPFLQWDCNETGSIPSYTAIGFFPPGTTPPAGQPMSSALPPSQRKLLDDPRSVLQR